MVRGSIVYGGQMKVHNNCMRIKFYDISWKFAIFVKKMKSTYLKLLQKKTMASEIFSSQTHLRSARRRCSEQFSIIDHWQIYAYYRSTRNSNRLLFCLLYRNAPIIHNSWIFNWDEVNEKNRKHTVIISIVYTPWPMFLFEFSFNIFGFSVVAMIFCIYTKVTKWFSALSSDHYARFGRYTFFPVHSLTLVVTVVIIICCYLVAVWY